MISQSSCTLCLQDTRVTATRAAFGHAARQEQDLLRRNQQSAAHLQQLEGDCEEACAQVATNNERIADLTRLIEEEEQLLVNKEAYLGVEHGKILQPLRERLPLPSDLQLQDYIAQLRQVAASERQQLQMNTANTAEHRRLQEDIALSKSSYNLAWGRARAVYGAIANPRLGKHQNCVYAIPHFVPGSLQQMLCQAAI